MDGEATELDFRGDVQLEELFLQISRSAAQTDPSHDLFEPNPATQRPKLEPQAETDFRWRRKPKPISHPARSLGDGMRNKIEEVTAHLRRALVLRNDEMTETLWRDLNRWFNEEYFPLYMGKAKGARPTPTPTSTTAMMKTAMTTAAETAKASAASIETSRTMAGTGSDTHPGSDLPASTVSSTKAGTVAPVVSTLAGTRSLPYSPRLRRFLTPEECTLPHVFHCQFLLTCIAVRRHDLATEVWKQMIESDLNPTLHCWVAIMRGCRFARDLSMLEQVWRQIRQSGQKLDAECWTTRIHCLMVCGERMQGLQELLVMGKSWKRAAVAECAASGDPAPDERTLALMGDVDRNPKPTIMTINAALSTLLWSRDSSIAQQMLAWATTLGIQPDRTTYNLLLRWMMKRGNPEAALQVYTTMRESGVEPDMYTFTTVCDSFFRLHTTRINTPDAVEGEGEGGGGGEAEAEAKPKAEATPGPGLEATAEADRDQAGDADHGNATDATDATDATLPTRAGPKARRQRSAAEAVRMIDDLIGQMDAVGIAQNIQAYGMLINGLVKHGARPNLHAIKATLIHMTARGYRPNAAINTMLLELYFTQIPPDLDAVEILWRRVEHEPDGTDVVLLDRIVQGYASVGDVDRTLDFLRRVPRLGMPLVRWYSLVTTLRMLVHQGRVAEASGLVTDVIRRQGVFRHGVRGPGGEDVFWELVRSLRASGVELPDLEEHHAQGYGDGGLRPPRKPYPMSGPPRRHPSVWMRDVLL
ncbi:MAG: hypothetical protein M1826_007755 [Phylliscum demangeonii]|nr:MAG: hypothetical protein M1826_007755 [Phylliscum demangeonii]